MDEHGDDEDGGEGVEPMDWEFIADDPGEEGAMVVANDASSSYH